MVDIRKKVDNKLQQMTTDQSWIQKEISEGIDVKLWVNKPA